MIRDVITEMYVYVCVCMCVCVWGGVRMYVCVCMCVFLLRKRI